MRHTIHTTHVSTIFGGAYVHEDHGDGPALKEPSTGSLGKWATTLIAGLFIATTAVGAIASSRTHGSRTDVQATPSFVLGLPGGFGRQDALFQGRARTA